MKAKARTRSGLRCDPFPREGRNTGPSQRGVDLEAELEHARRDPKDGELCPSRTKPGETLVEVRSDSDVQIDRLTWV